MKKAFLLAAAISMSAQAETVIEIDGKSFKVDIDKIEAITSNNCPKTYCDPADTDCDGKLDTTCKGLEYDLCTYGSVTVSFIQAAYTGFCYKADQASGDACGGLTFGGICTGS